MKKLLTMLAALALCAGVLAGCAGLGGYGGVLKANWGLTLPKAKQVYEADSGASFQGDGWRYHVFSCDAAELAAWQAPVGESLREKGMEWLDQIAVPAEQRPDWEKCAFCLRTDPEDSRDQLLLLWDTEAGQLYVLEQFM